MKPGRPTKLTPEITSAMVKALGLGLTLDQAGGAVGVSRATLHRWLAAGETDEGEFRDFRDAITGARAQRVQKLLEVVWAGMEDKLDGDKLHRGDWKAAWKLLETLEPRDFSAKVRGPLMEELEAAVQRVTNEFRNEPDIRRRALEALADEDRPIHPVASFEDPDASS